MNDHEKFELRIEINVSRPYKRQIKEEAINHMHNQLIKTGCKSVSTKDSYYIDRKSEAAVHSFVLILNVIAKLSIITVAALTIKRELTKAQNRGSVFLKDKNGKYVKIDEEMTAEEACDKLNETEKDD